jgi:hypothetical protein
MLNQEDIDEYLKQLAIHRRTLAHLLGQQGQFSAGHVPAHVANGIAEARAHIACIKATLRDAGAPVGGHPDDEAPLLAALPPTPHPLAAQPTIATGGGDYAGGNIDKRQGTFLQGGTTGTVIGSADTVTIYSGVAPSTEEAPSLAAQARSAELPLDTIPEVASLPTGSRMPFARNPLFVGRQEDLRALARALTSGATAAIGQVAAATGMGGIGKTHPTYYPSYSTITV